MLNVCYFCGKESPVWKNLCKKCGNKEKQCDPCREKSQKEIAYVCWHCHEGIQEGDELKNRINRGK